MPRIFSQRHVSVAFTIACLLISPICASWGPAKQAPVLPTDPYWELWLSSDTKGREAFLQGFLLGRQSAYLDGCANERIAVSDLFLPQRLSEEQIATVDKKCHEALNAYHLPVKAYARILTDISEHYPEDVRIPFDLVLLALSDLSKCEKSAEGVHQAIAVVK